MKIQKNFVKFQFLIGSLKTHMLSFYICFLYSFQFLIGSLKTRKPTERWQSDGKVSIPYR